MLLQWGIFLFFGAMIFIGTVMVYFLYPETKGLAMEDAPNVFKDHWYWKRYGARPNRLKEAVRPSSFSYHRCFCKDGVSCWGVLFLLCLQNLHQQRCQGLVV